MAVTRLECPECGAVLKRAEGVPEGRKVRCPSCSSTFTAAADRHDPRDDNQRARSRRNADRDDDYDDEDDRPRSKSRGKKAKKQNPAVLIAVPIIGAVGLLAVAIALYMTWPEKDKGAVAVNNGGGIPAVRPAPAPAPVPKGGPAGPGNAAGVGLEIGQVAMEIDGEDIDGQRFKLSDYRGKVVVLDFWGHW
ncbi:MAG TPA: MJ0042-type zinc finger domain-containing protein [Gemmataceae bacterium]|jgi:predicted Zn finger-like uncharacterized protein|nr:MJ0042-type zinc finger domain-containing protein [Gemmataceae bacterium]